VLLYTEILGGIIWKVRVEILCGEDSFKKKEERVKKEKGGAKQNVGKRRKSRDMLLQKNLR
jgi:hypothetical protein